MYKQGRIEGRSGWGSRGVVVQEDNEREREEKRGEEESKEREREGNKVGHRGGQERTKRAGKW